MPKKYKISIQTDLEGCFNRLQHLVYIYYNPNSVAAGFGMDETMENLRNELPEMVKRYNFLTLDKSDAKI